MRLKVDKDNDTPYFRLYESDVMESEKVEPGIISDYNKSGKVIGIEILNVSQRVRPDELNFLKYETA